MNIGTAQEFLDSVIRHIPKGASIGVTGFSQSPKKDDKGGGGDWLPKKVNGTMPACINTNNNTYFCISSLHQKENGFRAQESNIAALHAVIVDDVGQKLDRESLSLPPSWVVETSQDNYQAGYILSEPITDRKLAHEFSKKFVVAAGGDQSADNPVRWARLPFGINSKKSVIDSWGEEFETLLTEWSPYLRYTTEQIAEAFVFSWGSQVTEGNISNDDWLIDYKPPVTLDPADEGERNRTLARIVGKEMYDSNDTQKAMLLALGWNASLSYPLSEGEVIATCNSIINKHRKDHPESIDSPMEDLPIIDVDWMLSSDPAEREFLFSTLNIPAGELCGIAGTGGVGKSMILEQLAMSLATGALWLNKWRPTKPICCFYLTMEDSPDEIHRRFSAILKGGELLGNVSYHHDLLKQNLKIISAMGHDFSIIKKGSNNSLVHGEGLKWIIDSVNEVGRESIVILDPLRNMIDGEENGETFKSVVNALRRVSRETTPQTTLMISHHASQTATANQDLTEAAFRGATDLVNGLRWTMVIQRHDDGTDKHNTSLRQTAMPKVNYGKPVKDGIFLEWTPQGFVFTDYKHRKDNHAIEKIEEMKKELILYLQEHEVRGTSELVSIFSDKYAKNKIENTVREEIRSGQLIRQGKGKAQRLSVNTEYQPS